MKPYTPELRKAQSLSSILTSLFRKTAARILFAETEIKTILKHNTGRKAFIEFLKRINHIEYLYFWFDVEVFVNEDATSDDELTTRAHDIYDKYFSQSAQYPVAISEDASQNDYMCDYIESQIYVEVKNFGVVRYENFL